MNRRTLLTLLATAGLGPHRAEAAPPTRIASLDYALTETLLALGVAPVALTEAGDWDVWVVEPELPAGIVDIGSELEVNFELLAQVRPDLILTSPYNDRLVPSLERIAPVLRLAIYAEGGSPLARAKSVARTLGDRLGRARRAETFIGETEAEFDDCAERISAMQSPPAYLVSFMDPRHVRVYGRASLYQDVLDRIGMSNAWAGETNYWGFATVGIEHLATRRDVRLIAMDPVPPDVWPLLAASALWTRLPFVEHGHVSTMPAVLMFGGVPSARRFARLLVAHLERLA